MATGVERYVDQLIEDGVFKTRGEVAAACGMGDAALSRALSDGYKGTLTVEQCLRLALELGEHPAAVLRIAGRKDVAQLVDDLWPRRTPRNGLTRREREHLALWRQATVRTRHSLDAILVQLHAKGTARTVGTSGTSDATRKRSQRGRS